jgi:hypothetical protein
LPMPSESITPVSTPMPSLSRTTSSELPPELAVMFKPMPPLLKVAVAVVSPRRLPPLRLKSAACAIAGTVAAKTTAAKVFNLDMESP